MTLTPEDESVFGRFTYVGSVPYSIVQVAGVTGPFRNWHVTSGAPTSTVTLKMLFVESSAWGYKNYHIIKTTTSSTTTTKTTTTTTNALKTKCIFLYNSTQNMIYLRLKVVLFLEVASWHGISSCDNITVLLTVCKCLSYTVAWFPYAHLHTILKAPSWQEVHPLSN